MSWCGNSGVHIVIIACENYPGLLLLLRYCWKLGYLSLCLVKDRLECLESLKYREGLRFWSCWSIVCCREENQAGLAAIVGGTLQQEKILRLGRRWRWRRWGNGRRGRQRNKLQAIGGLNHKVVLRGVGGNIKCWLGHNQAAVVS